MPWKDWIVYAYNEKKNYWAYYFAETILFLYVISSSTDDATEDRYRCLRRSSQWFMYQKMRVRYFYEKALISLYVKL